jgi:hypothetical protein
VAIFHRQSLGCETTAAAKCNLGSAKKRKIWKKMQRKLLILLGCSPRRSYVRTFYGCSVTLKEPLHSPRFCSVIAM